MGRILWVPDEARQRSTRLWAFAEATAATHGRPPADYAGLHAWSLAEPGPFWSSVWDFCGLVGDKGPGPAFVAGAGMRDARFFPEARLNYAENLLRHTGPEDAIVWRDETKRGRMSRDALRAEVGRLQRAMGALGVGPGDRVAALVPNGPEAICLMLATTAIGAVWASCSPDFGSRGVLDRFAQIAPKLLIVVDGYRYNGKAIDVAPTVRGLDGLEPLATIVIDNAGGGAALADELAGGVLYDAFAARGGEGPPTFARLPFAQPLFIMFSSGTTGQPKCIVHSAGGTLLQHAKEHQLHADIRPGDRVFYFTTCGWMMWNWLCSALAAGATLCLYDGAPAYPDAGQLFAYAAEEKFTLLGTSARFIDTLRHAGFDAADYDLSALRTLLSTGSPLLPESFAFAYDHIKPDMHLASISGGTDIISCFALGAPTLPVHSGELQVAGLGMAVDVFDESGRPVRGAKGELVCTQAFPSMPLGFWNDPGGRRYGEAYFERFDAVWAHGDFAEWTDSGGLVIHGRSDATLNPGGVRIGTAEIYAVVEAMAEIDAALCVGQEWGGDVRIVLFVRLRDGVTLSETLRAEIARRIRREASPRHVPARIIAVADLPRTRSGKLVELAVREVIHGRPVRNIESLANPEALALFDDLPELRS